MRDLSFHFLASHNWAYAQDIIRASGIRSAFLLDPSPPQIDFALQHCDFVVVRIFDPFNEYYGGSNPDFEKTILDNHSPSEFVNWMNTRFAAFKGNPKIRWVLGWNELYARRGNAEREQNHKMTAIARALVNAGYGVGLGGWATDKSFYQDDIDSGHWDEIILFAVANKAWVSFDAHEYTVTRTAQQHLKSHGSEGYPDCLLNPQVMTKSNWGSVAYTGSAIAGNWHIGRIAWVLERAEQIAGQHFMWYRGECAHDFKDDGALKDFINNQFTPRFGKPRGINTLFSYYQHLAGGQLTNDKFNEMLFDDYAWLALNSPNSNQANFIFAHNGGWPDFDTSIGDRTSFVNRIKNHVTTGTPTEPPVEPPPTNPTYDFKSSDYGLFAVSTTMGGKVRARNTYGLNSVILDVFFDGSPKDVALVHPNKNIPDYPPKSDGYTWVYAVHEGGIGAWSAWELLNASPANQPPPPPSEDYEAMIEAIRAIVCK